MDLSGRGHKNLYENILTPHHLQGHMMTVLSEELLDEVTVQVWLLYPHLSLNMPQS